MVLLTLNEYVYLFVCFTFCFCLFSINFGKLIFSQNTHSTRAIDWPTSISRTHNQYQCLSFRKIRTQAHTHTIHIFMLLLYAHKCIKTKCFLINKLWNRWNSKNKSSCNQKYSFLFSVLHFHFFFGIWLAPK